MLMCNFVLRSICLSTFSHDTVRILASPELITGGAPNCKTGELVIFSSFCPWSVAKKIVEFWEKSLVIDSEFWFEYGLWILSTGLVIGW